MTTTAYFRALPLHLKICVSIKKCYQRHPIALIALGHAFVGTFSYFFYVNKLLTTNQHLFPRYRAWYTVVRPDDIRLKLTPKRFVTDKQFLPDDHHDYMDDAPTTLVPPVSFRANRERLGGHGYVQ